MEHDTHKIQPINIREVFRSKNPKLAGLLPGFVIRYLEKIVHQREINHFLERHGDKTGLDFVHAVIEEFNVKLTVEGIDDIPSTGRYIIASNHPLGGFDGLLLMSVLEKKFNGFKVLVNDLLMNIRNLHPLFIPINKHGKQDMDAARILDETYRSDIQILTFPSGFVSRRIKGQIVDLVWKKNFITKSVQYQRDIVPVFVSGRNSEFFYRLGTIRRLLGIKANLEMFYLVDETFKHRHKSISIIFGTPISHQVFDKSRKYIEWAKWVKEQVYALNGINSIPL
ncbi:MAG: 1-acyl-sn-glycerol-3-phosphate acyltransferase [Bacteroidales bacterium]|nr:1-acyl-sn-glycerol-3-phosphate acyltransferase [Bacteroidales bacterium]